MKEDVLFGMTRLSHVPPEKRTEYARHIRELSTLIPLEDVLSIFVAEAAARGWPSGAHVEIRIRTALVALKQNQT